jgi:hypothetical protein
MKLPMSGGFFHRIVMRQDRYKTLSSRYDFPYTMDQCAEINYNHEYVEPKATYTREQFGFAENDFIVITVGHRLQYDLKEQLIDDFCENAAQNANLKWLIVGCETFPYIEHSFPELVGKQIKLWGYEQDLPALYRICDVYMNPFRTGGMLSVNWARHQSLAIATPKSGSSDDDFFFTGDEFSVPTENDLVPYILELMDDKELLERNQRFMKAKADSFSVETAIGQFKIEIDKLISEYYTERLWQGQ